MVATKKVLLLVPLSIAAVIIFGTTAIVASPPKADAADSAQKAPIYERNESGQTYGCMFDAPSPELEPDLIAATATNGEEGYVLKSELDEATGYSKSDAVLAREYSVRVDKSATVLRDSLNEQLPFGMEIDSDCARQVIEALYQSDTPGPSVSDAAEIVESSLPSSSTMTQSEIESDLQEALIEAESELTIYIPVYLKDGKTKIGDFPVSTF